jgi:hypothetical protein
VKGNDCSIVQIIFCYFYFLNLFSLIDDILSSGWWAKHCQFQVNQQRFYYLFNRTWQQLVDEVTPKNRFLYHLPNPYQSRTFCKLLFTILSKNLNSVMDLSAIASGIPLNLERAKFSISSNIECKGGIRFLVNLLRTQTSV